MARAAVADAAQLGAEPIIRGVVDGYREAPAAVRTPGLRALARAAQDRLPGGRALARVARALAEAGATDEAVPLAVTALAQAEASHPTFDFERTEALADASAALARAGAGDQLAAHPTTDPVVLAAIAIGYAQAGDTARAATARDAAEAGGDHDRLGAVLARLAADVWLGRIDRARAAVATLPAGQRPLAHIALARVAVEAHRADAVALVTAAQAALAAYRTPAGASVDDRARDRETSLAGQTALARLRLRAGDRAGALAAVDRFAASIPAASPGLYETAALADAAQVAAEAGDDARARALSRRAAGGALADVHPAPAAEVDRLTRAGSFLEALDIAYDHAGVTSTFYAQILTRAAAAGPLDPTVARRLREQVCRP